VETADPEAAAAWCRSEARRQARNAQSEDLGPHIAFVASYAAARLPHQRNPAQPPLEQAGFINDG